MATKYWIGGTTAVTQVTDLTPGGTIEANDNFTITLTNEAGDTASINAVAGGTTVADVTAALLAAWNASTSSLKNGITATDEATTFRLTGTAGVPFYVSVATTENGGGAADAQTFGASTTTACQGPYDWNTASNWSDLAVPVSTDTVILDGRGAANQIIYGLNQSAVTLANFLHYATMAAAVGTSTAALRISATIGQNGLSAGNGSQATPGFFNINLGTVATNWSSWSSAAATSGLQGAIITGNEATNILNVYGGTVGTGTMTPGQTATWATINVSGANSKLTTGTGTAWTTLVNNGGAVILNKAGGTDLTNLRGTTTINGTAAVTNVYAVGGTVYPNNRVSGSEITTLYMRGGTVNTRSNASAIAIGTLNIREGGALQTFNTNQLTIGTVTFDQAVPCNFQIQAKAA